MFEGLRALGLGGLVSQLTEGTLYRLLFWGGGGVGLTEGTLCRLLFWGGAGWGGVGWGVWRGREW